METFYKLGGGETLYKNWDGDDAERLYKWGGGATCCMTTGAVGGNREEEILYRWGVGVKMLHEEGGG